MPTEALINGETLKAARERSGLEASTVAQKVGVAIDKIVAWEESHRKPTFLQAQKLANLMHIPFGFLFLPELPEIEIPIPDLRTVGNSGTQAPSAEMLEVIQDAIDKQDWLKEYFIQNEFDPLKYVGSFSVESKIDDVVSAIRDEIQVGVPIRGSWEDYFRDLIRGAELARIVVLRSGIVGGNTHRKLEVNEFRGFAICDDMAPLIFINSADAPSARLFTFIHELAHIWINNSGVSDSFNSDRKEERFCNQVAGEFLVPHWRLQELWRPKEGLLSNLSFCASKLHVSKLVIAKRALDVDLLSKTGYWEYYRTELQSFRNQPSSGGSYYTNAAAKNGQLLSRHVLSEALSGRMLLRDASKLLGVQPANLRNYARSL